jgi:hypothetical protein
MKLATKVNKLIFEAIHDYNGKVNGFNCEAGDTSWDNDHYHKTKIDQDGNGQTLETLPKEIRDEMHHVHKIVRWVVQVENDHDHKVIS